MLSCVRLLQLLYTSKNIIDSSLKAIKEGVILKYGGCWWGERCFSSKRQLQSQLSKKSIVEVIV